MYDVVLVDKSFKLYHLKAAALGARVLDACTLTEGSLLSKRPGHHRDHADARIMVSTCKHRAPSLGSDENVAGVCAV